MKYYVIVFTLGLLLGLFYSFMYRALSVDSVKPSVYKKSMVEIKKEVAQSEVVYTKHIDSLKKKNKKLEQELVGTKKTLTEVKQQNHSLKVQVYALIDRVREPLPRTESSESSCDSLITTVEYLMQSNVEKDSLYEVAALNLEEQLRNKDSTVTLKHEQYKNLKTTFEKSLSSQQQLIDENKLLGRQVKKQKLKSKILSAAIFIISGAAANHFLQH
jgi:FtsZ-binding cell division protein ZapB